jgi:hypothetical protein
MPSYRNANNEYSRKPKMKYESDYEPEMDGEEEEMKKEKKPCICKIECPFKIIVKVVPGDCDDHKRPCKE